MSTFGDLLEARHRFLAENNPLAGARAIFSPGYFEALESEMESSLRWPASQPERVAGIPFSISRALPVHVLAVIYSGAEPFDPHHPERTVTIRSVTPCPDGEDEP